MSSSKPISAIMTISPVVANETTKFSQVLRLFTEFPVHHLPVVNAQNKLIGMVSSNDLPKVFLTLYNGSKKTIDLDSIDSEIKITELMTPSPVTVSSSDSISTAAKILVDKKFLSLPVVDNSELIGIVTMKDVMAYAADLL